MICGLNIMSLVARKPVFRISHQVIPKTACSATETSKNIGFSHIASLDMILSKKRIPKVLSRLRGSNKSYLCKEFIHESSCICPNLDIIRLIIVTLGLKKYSNNHLHNKYTDKQTNLSVKLLIFLSISFNICLGYS